MDPPFAPSPLSLCTACLAIRKSSDFQVEGRHHGTRESLLQSVQDGCYFCKSLWNTADDTVKNDSTKQFETAFSLSEWGEDSYNFSLSSTNPDIRMYWGIRLFAQDTLQAAVLGEKIKPGAEKADVPPQVDVEQVKAWMQGCGLTDREHFACNPRLDLPYLVPPSRLLDLGEKDSTTFKVIVMESASWTDETSEFTTLSHIPEPHPKLTLTESTTDRLLAGCSDADVDDAIRRAFQVTRSIGFRYMWVPCLCVLQDSESEATDNAAYKCDSYLLSSLNLVNCSAPTKARADIRDEDFIYLAKDACWSGSAKDYIAMDHDWWNRNIDLVPIWKQPGHFAERFIPGRILYLDHWSGQVFYECRARLGRASSIFPKGVPDMSGSTAGLLHGLLGTCLLQNPVEGTTLDGFDPSPLLSLFQDASTALSQLMSTGAPSNGPDLPDVASLALAESTLSHQDGERAVGRLATSNPLLRYIAPVARFFRIYIAGPYHAGHLNLQFIYSLTWHGTDDWMPSAALPAARVVSDPPTPSWSWASVMKPQRVASSSMEWGTMPLALCEPPATDFLGGLRADEAGDVPQERQFDGAECRLNSQLVPCSIEVLPDGWKHGGFKINDRAVNSQMYRLYPDVRPGVQETKKCGLIPISFKLARGYYNFCFCLIVEEAGEERQKVATENCKAYVRIGLVILEDEEAQPIAEMFGLKFSESGVDVDRSEWESSLTEYRLV